MAKIRGIKPETWTDDKFVQLSPLARLLFIGMWNLACDNGHVEDNEVQLKIRLLPMDSAKVHELVDEMVTTGQVERHDGYLKVVKLSEHQKIDLYWLTLCEWCEHDGDKTFNPSDRKGSKKGTSLATDGSKSGTSLATDYERRGDELRGVDIPKPAARRAAQLPSDWSPNDAHRAIAGERTIQLDAEVEKFRDWAAANGITKKDWDATFRNWLRNARPNLSAARPDNRIPNAPIPQPPDGLTDEQMWEWHAEQRRRA